MNLPLCCLPKHSRRNVLACPVFSLIELLCVLAIVGLLSTLAMPVYQNAQARSKRQLAKVALVKSAQWLEQAAMATGRYPAVLPDSVW